MANKTIEQGIVQRGQTYLVHVHYKGKRRTASVPVSEGLEAARNKRTLIKAEMIQGKIAKKEGRGKGDWTVHYALNKTWETEWKHQAQASYIKLKIGQIEDYFGKNVKIRDITADSLDEWIAELQDDGNANGTINRKLSCLSKAMQMAVERGGIPVKPKFPRLPEYGGRIRFITGKEEKQIIQLLTQWGHRDGLDAFIVLLDTGMRTGELRKVTEADVGEKVVSLWNTKNHTSRSVPMTKRVQEILWRRKESLSPTDFLFPFNKHWLRAWWGRVKVTMELGNDKQFVPHCLRHTCASRLVQRGVSIPVVKEWLGHKAIQVTMRYSHLSPTSLLDSVHVLE